MCVCVLSSHLFWTSGLWTYQPGPHRISPPSFCGACLHYFREKDSAVPFCRRPSSRILCTNELNVLHLLGIFFCEKKSQFVLPRGYVMSGGVVYEGSVVIQGTKVIKEVWYTTGVWYVWRCGMPEGYGIQCVCGTIERGIW